MWKRRDQTHFSTLSGWPYKPKLVSYFTSELGPDHFAHVNRCPHIGRNPLTLYFSGTNEVVLRQYTLAAAC